MLTQEPAGAPLSLDQDHRLTSHAGAFRKLAYLRLPAAPAGSTLVVDQAKLKLVFKNITYNALTTEPEATLSAKGGAVVVTLDGPRQLDRLVLTPHASAVKLHRMDGETIADQATTTARQPRRGRTRKRDGGFLFGSRGPNFLRPAQDFRDQQFAMRLTEGDLSVGRVKAVHLDGIPSGPRIHIAYADALDAPQLLWRGEDARNLDLGDLLAETVPRFLRDEPWGQAVDLVIIFESDEPCDIHIDVFELTHHFKRPIWAEKQKKTFPGLRPTQGEVNLELPTGAAILSLDLKPRNALAEQSLVAVGEVSLSQTGVTLRDNQWAGVPLFKDHPRDLAPATQTQGATQIFGFALGLKALAPETELRLQLQTGDDRPSGKVMAEAGHLLQLGGSDWVYLAFPKHVSLESQPYWLLLHVVSGAAVWLTQTEGQTALWRTSTAERQPDQRFKGAAQCRPLIQVTTKLRARLEDQLLEVTPTETGGLFSFSRRQTPGTFGGVTTQTITLETSGEGSITLDTSDVHFRHV